MAHAASVYLVSLKSSADMRRADDDDEDDDAVRRRRYDDGTKDLAPEAEIPGIVSTAQVEGDRGIMAGAFWGPPWPTNAASAEGEAARRSDANATAAAITAGDERRNGIVFAE